MEEWREVEKGYLVSNNNGWAKTNCKEQPCGYVRSSGYRFVYIHRKAIAYHILVAKAFPEICGEWFEGAQVHHINGDKLDNRPENLVVLSANEHHKLHYQSQPDTFKKPSPQRSASISKALTGRRADYKHIPILQYDKNHVLVKEWECITDVQKELGYSAGNICWCCKGNLKTAYGYIWKYKKDAS